jgi:hypothetical protein
MTAVEYLFTHLFPYLDFSNVEDRIKIRQFEQDALNMEGKQLADESWEGCDGCTEQDEVMYKNGYAKGYSAAMAELYKEISDEEIHTGRDDRSNH